MRGTHPERALEQAVERDAVLRRGERVLVACSGGADSVALAAILSVLRKSLDLQLTLGHVNHGIRPSAWQDEAVVLRVSAALGIPALVAAPAVMGSAEAALREARYAALVDLAGQCGANAIATAHTAEDQSETVLLALFRGTGERGLGGMAQRRQLAAGIDLIRPLLRRDREDVVRYVQAAALPYAVDPTNADLSYRRNAVREALAALRPLFPGLDEAVARAAYLAGDGSTAAAHRRKVRQTLAGHRALNDVDFEHISAAVRALEAGRSGRFHMRAGLELSVENGELTVHREVK